MSDTSVGLVSAVIVALAHTWDHKLPGFRSEFVEQLGNVYMQTSPVDVALRNALDTIIRTLDAA
jgi:hypothetical protein